MDTQKIMHDNMLCRMLAGSQAYGTSLPTSDTDYRGLFFAPQEYIRTPFFGINEVTDTSEEDTKYYEINKFLQLFTLANPNILELLYTDYSKIELTSDPYELLRKNADKMLSSKVAFTFSGYAIAQLKRIRGHNKWITNPQPVEAPRQIDYLTLVQNFTEEKLFKLDIESLHDGWILMPYGGHLYGLYKADGFQSFNADFTLKPFKEEQAENNPFVDETGQFRKTPQYIVKYNHSQYDADKDMWKNYWNWKKNRNVARGSLEEQFGYDTKHAMHLVRLLNMGEEILSTGQVHVLRPDAELLLDIRAGKWSYDEVIEFAEQKDALIRDTLYHSTALPKHPDLQFASKLLIEVQDMCWSGQINLRKAN